MEQPLSSRPSLRTILVVLVLALALALAAAVSRVGLSSGTGGSQPSQGPGHTTTTSVPYVLAPDATPNAKDWNDRVSQPIDYGGPCWPCVGGAPDSPPPADVP